MKKEEEKGRSTSYYSNTRTPIQDMYRWDKSASTSESSIYAYVGRSNTNQPSSYKKDDKEDKKSSSGCFSCVKKNKEKETDHYQKK